jgi:hypothetical protein
VIPIILASWVSCWLENRARAAAFLDEKLLRAADLLAVTVPLTFLVIGPLATWLSQMLANGYQLFTFWRRGWRARRWARCGRCALFSACTGGWCR